MQIKAKKARIHSNASPVFKLLKEKEDFDKGIEVSPIT